METKITPKVVLSYGMGVDSTAILLRWLTEPTSRDFDLSELLVITAMTGDEFSSTGRHVSAHVLPILREHGVRFVQVARGGLLEKSGVKVLDDSNAPAELFLDGAFKLSDEMRIAGTIPTSGGTRKCSLKYKGWVIDSFLGDELDGAPFIHAIGFNSDETRRVKKDQVYGKAGGRTASYPLVDWGWDRDNCLDFIFAVTGIDWLKSACSFCPFSRGCDEVLERFDTEPEGAALAIEMERVALSFNPRMLLYKTKSVEALIANRNAKHPALSMAGDSELKQEWGVYRLVRAMLPRDNRTADQRKKTHPDYVSAPIWNPDKRGTTQRSIERIGEADTQEGAGHELQRHAERLGLTVEAGRVVVRDTGDGFPRIEELLTVAPITVATKHGRWGRDKFRAHVERVELVLDQPAPSGSQATLSFEAQPSDRTLNTVWIP